MTINPQIQIAIDGNEANVTHRVGSNIYAFEILKALEKLTKHTSQLQCTILLAQPASKDLPKVRPGWKYQVLKPSFLWTQLAFPAHLFTHQHFYDVVYTPGHYAPRLARVRYVSSIMDLGFLKFPEQFKKKDFIQLRDWTAYSAKHAHKVIAISEHTKLDVAKTYKKSHADIVVAHPNIDSSIKAVPQLTVNKVLKKYKISKPYILYVGTLQPRKNLIKLIEAFERVHRVIINHDRDVKLRSKHELRQSIPYRSLQLVIAGKTGWLAEDIINKIETSPIKDHIILTGFIDEQSKNALYQGANVATLVGLYEGFGIPALEALAHGVIPVVSNSSSLPEVVGKAGIQVDPQNPASIADGLLTALLLSAKDRAKLRKEARKQLAFFSWEKSAQIILDTLIKVARKSTS